MKKTVVVDPGREAETVLDDEMPDPSLLGERPEFVDTGCIALGGTSGVELLESSQLSQALPLEHDRPDERVDGVWVAYGVGNILSNLPVNDSWPASSQTR